MKKRHIAFWIIFPIIFVIISLLLLFYLDLANGPLICFITEIVALILFFIARVLFINSKFIKRLLLWLIFIFANVFIIIMAHPKIAPKSAAYYNNPTKTDVLDTLYGKIQGVYNEDNSVRIYAGIPYAKPPVGDLRWREPENPDKWDGVRDCSYFAKKSYQQKSNEVFSSLVDIYAEKGYHPNFKSKEIEDMSEDSLYLNVWRPNNNETNLPILVFIHGGSLTSGSSSFEDYNGEEMAKKNVIMITITYRLGIFGYFAHQDLINESKNKTTGNYGLLDQIKALEWVNDNAKYFGGDKNNITVAGESAGSSSVSAICTSPLAKGLFKRAIGESSSLVVKRPPHTYRGLSTALKMGTDIMKEFNVTTIDELRKIDPEKLVYSKYTNSEMTLDGYALTKNPYDVYKDKENNEEALLNGYNVKEADAFVIPQYLFSSTNKNNIEERLNKLFTTEITKEILDLYKDEIEKDAFSAFNEIISIWWFIYPHHSWSRMAEASGIDVYRYQFTKENGYYGTYHSGEMIYAYGNVKKCEYSYRYDDKDRELSDIMLNYWVNFIKTGNPNKEGSIKWEKWNSKDNKVIEFGENVGMIDDKYLSLYKIYDKFLNV